MKSKKGFTLIELLAIIVILAIIAVITVPIILNIIDDSSKGAAADSAYGYKDSVQKFYLGKSISDDTIDPVYETETVKTVAQLETDGLTVSGDKPSDGWVQLNKGQVVDYSLKFGDYVVNFDTTTNTPVSTKNGVLKVQPALGNSCPGVGCKYIYTEETLTIGTTSMPKSTATDDYTNWTSGQNGHPYFLGLIESTDGLEKIGRAYACGIIDEQLFCLEGYDSSTPINSITSSALTSIGGCSPSNGDLYCETAGLILNRLTSGYAAVTLEDDTGGCNVHNNGLLSCWTE